MTAIETTFIGIDCIGDYYFNIDTSESYPLLAIMVRDVRDHTFSSLDCLWALRKVYILPRVSGKHELMTQQNGLDTNALGQWFELAAGPIVSQSLT